MATSKALKKTPEAEKAFTKCRGVHGQLRSVLAKNIFAILLHHYRNYGKHANEDSQEIYHHVLLRGPHKPLPLGIGILPGMSFIVNSFIPRPTDEWKIMVDDMLTALHNLTWTELNMVRHKFFYFVRGYYGYEKLFDKNCFPELYKKDMEEIERYAFW